MRSASETRAVRARLFTRANCSLCDKAGVILARLEEEGLLLVERVDISESPSLTELYGSRIPVVTLATGELFDGRISEFRLRRALERK